ncbi:MAG: phosphoglucosamine mutase [Nitrospirota bacterium]|nr:phosphoglucosamine mutase [Nitrospirota bacterium]
MRQLFGTDGIRGTANVDPMTSEMALKLGRAIAYLFKNRKGRHKIVIGKDTRLSGYMLETALTSGICSMGVDVILVGPMPTPAISVITKSLRADAGVVISASHNSYEDNGIKFFSRDGLKLPDEMEREIERLIFSGDLDAIRPTATDIGKASKIEDAVGRYVEYVKATLPKGFDFSGLKVVVDCAHGAAYRVTPMVFQELGAEIIPLGVKPDGTNINAGCGCLYPDAMQQAVMTHGAHLGLAHDGDADRVLFADERGNLVDGDQVMGLCAKELKRDGRLAKDTLVTTVMSNLGLELAMREAGIRTERTQVGDRYVLEHMLAGGFNFGGEQSGHIIFLDHNLTGDGLITALQVCHYMVRSGQPLSTLANCMTPMPQVLLGGRVARKPDLDGIPVVVRTRRAIEDKLGTSGRMLVRYSGTEPLVRVMLEGPDEGTIRTLAQEMLDTILGQVGVEES